jgi:TRAP-type C4-dicarboxylate transport system permease small subunit
MNTESIEGLREAGLWRSVEALIDALIVLSSMTTTTLIFSTVIARYFFKTDIYASEEIILTISFWLYFAGGIKGSIEDTHIKADLMDVYLKNSAKYCMKVLAKAIEALVNVVLSIWSVNLVILNFHRMPKTVGLKIPIIIAQIPIALGFLLMAVFSVYYGILYGSRLLKPAKQGGK